ncbi:MAG TPA: L,D-transpeptidase family protein [Pyrinomonadaceae bacterium]|jgi:lipoprotein-anchoring transpeptidase ErfK/SrfK|nr:L,D-transpeptidase family protein [Pyrinomonadaceae bacterium]
MHTKFYRLALYFGAVAIVILGSETARGQRVSLLEAEKKLASLGYWVTRADGRADASTRHSITAFQKVEGLKRTGVLNPTVMKALRSADKPEPKYTNVPAHVEVDIKRQVLFFVDDAGVVTHVLPVSTGNDKKFFDKGEWNLAVTPRGAFDIYSKINGVRKSSLGEMYYPSYFVGGVAMHGSNSIPPNPASHGCVRVPRFAERALFRMTPIGMKVFVYD